MSRKYLYLCIIALVPQLYGCLWNRVHFKGELDAEGLPTDEEVSIEVPQEGPIERL